MADESDRVIADSRGFFAELERVCPEAASGLAVAGPPPPMLSLRDRVRVLRTLPDNAGVDAFLAAWRDFVEANPAAVISDRDT
ncbi:MAG TPA: hypothetical protein VL157_08535 [Gemmatimonadaceae bacterium]|nr:hypothetical protein [Gemmatimonadaceae bacterium]